jgi:hypothetical protein
MFKLQDINNKSTRLLNLRISHATSNYVFWGFGEMSLNEVLAICKSFKLKDKNSTVCKKKRCI